jgi:hypothetical protein
MRAFLVMVLLTSLTGCISAPLRSNNPRIPSKDGTLSELRKLAATFSHAAVIAAIAEAREVMIYEGLPNSNWDPSFETEVSRKDVLQFHSVPFYAPPQIPKKGDLKEITAFLKGSFPSESATFSPPKQCGDFHADFCVMFKNGTKKVGVMFCFTCADLVAFTDDAFWLVGIEEKSGLQSLKEVLFRYRSKRPPERLPNSKGSVSAAARGKTPVEEARE